MSSLKKQILDAEERLRQEIGKLWAKLRDPEVPEEEKGKIRTAIKDLETSLRHETGNIRGLCKLK
jgi:hypothetical protein